MPVTGMEQVDAFFFSWFDMHFKYFFFHNNVEATLLVGVGEHVELLNYSGGLFYL